MKRILLFAFGASMMVAASAQFNAQGDNSRFTTHILPAKHTLNDRGVGTYFLDYAAYDENFLGNTVNGGVYGDLVFSRTDTTSFVVPFVAEYYDSLVFSADGVTWDALNWSDVLSLSIDSVFIILNVDNTSGTPNEMKMKIATPTTVVAGAGNWLNFNNVLWQDSVTTTTDVGSISGATITFDILAMAPGITVTDKFAIMFEFEGNVADTCRLRWAYPTDGAACASGAITNPPKEWELYPTSFYNISLGGNPDMSQIESITLPRVNGTGTFAYYTDCDAPATPYIGDVAANGSDPNKNQFQHWNISAVVTITDNAGIAEQNEKGIKVAAYPVPAIETTTIEFNLINEAENVTLTLTDLGGRVVSSQVLGAYAAGKNKVTVDTNFPSGVYTYTLNVDGTSITRKIVIGGK